MSNTPDAASATPAATSASNRSNRTLGRGGRGRGYHAQGRGQANNNRRANEFKGSTPGMNGHVFQCYGEGTEKNQYTRTVEELEVYVGAHFKHNATDIKRMVRTMADAMFTPPKDLTDKKTKTEVAIWKAKVDMFVKRKDTYQENKCTLYSIIWSQCSEAMQAKVKSATNYEDMHDDNDSLLLLAEIKGISYKFESQKNIYVALDMAKSTFYSSRQAQNETNASYMTRFKDSIAVIEHYGGSIGDDEALVEEETKRLLARTKTQPDQAQLDACTMRAKNKAHAIAFLRRADLTRYSALLTEPGEPVHPWHRPIPDYSYGHVQLARELQEAHDPGATRGRDNTTTNTAGAPNASPPPAAQTELPFAQTGVAPPIDTIQCYNCQGMGHYASSCTAAPRSRRGGPASGVQMLQHTGAPTDDDDDNDDKLDFCFQMNCDSAIDPNWILLDSESTVSIFCNKRLLKNIRHCGDPDGLRIYSNGGHQDTHLIGDLPGFGVVWYIKQSLVNILSLAAVRKICRVTMDTSEEAALVVHKHNGQKLAFMESSNGLYFYDTSKGRKTSTDYSFATTVLQNKSMYTNRQVQSADLARRVYSLVGRPSHATFIKMITQNQLDGCPVTVHDVNRALKIYGLDVATLRCKTVHTTPDHIPSDQVEQILPAILKEHGDATVCFDIFFVDRHAFLGTVSRNIHFITVEHITSRHIQKCILPCLQKVNNVYKSRGFRITMMHADEEFPSTRNGLLEMDNIGLNIAATNEHVPKIEHTIRTIKERNQGTVSILPFKHYPKLLKIELVKNAVIWLNMLPHPDGISDNMSPRTVMTGL